MDVIYNYNTLLKFISALDRTAFDVKTAVVVQTVHIFKSNIR